MEGVVAHSSGTTNKKGIERDLPEQSVEGAGQDAVTETTQQASREHVLEQKDEPQQQEQEGSKAQVSQEREEGQEDQHVGQENVSQHRQEEQEQEAGQEHVAEQQVQLHREEHKVVQDHVEQQNQEEKEQEIRQEHLSKQQEEKQQKHEKQDLEKDLSAEGVGSAPTAASNAAVLQIGSSQGQNENGKSKEQVDGLPTEAEASERTSRNIHDHLDLQQTADQREDRQRLQLLREAGVLESSGSEGTITPNEDAEQVLQEDCRNKQFSCLAVTFQTRNSFQIARSKAVIVTCQAQARLVLWLTGQTVM